MKKTLTFFVLLFAVSLFAQKDSLKLGDKYWEDQLYISVTYNTLNNQPTGSGGSGFSYGLSAGYIKDIPFNKKGSWALGVGAGYGFDTFNHGVRVDANGDLTVNSGVTSNEMKLHRIEFPIQLRWRTSTAVDYTFWRVYAGVKLSYNLSNDFTYIFEDQRYTFSNIDAYNNFQTGVELSAGYGVFNFYIYYGLSPIYKDISIGNEKVNTKIARFGLIFYLL